MASAASFWLRPCATVGDMKYTSQHCYVKTIDDKMALYRECCFPNWTKLWWIKLLS